MARGVAVLFAALALLAVLAAGFGAKAARAEGSIWDKAVSIGSDYKDYVADADGFVIVHFQRDENWGVDLISSSGKVFTSVAGAGTNEFDDSTMIIPIGKGDSLNVSNKAIHSAVFVPSGGAAVDDRVSGKQQHKIS